MLRRLVSHAMYVTNDFVCARRSPTTIRVREAHVEKLNKLSEMEYEILHVLEFNRLVHRILFIWLYSFATLSMLHIPSICFVSHCSVLQMGLHF